MGDMTASSHHSFEAQVSAIRIEILSALIAFVMSFLVMFGWWRRWCTHWFIQKGVMVAYILSFTLVTYTIGLMQSATVKVEVYPVWAVCFLTVFGCTNSIKAYSLEDNYRIWRQLVQYVLYTIYVLLILFSVADGVSFIAVFLMLIITLVKVYIRIASSKTATDSSLYSKIAADYMDMENEKTSRPEDYNPVNMKGYCYLISGKFKSQDWSSAPSIKYKAPNYALEGVVENFDVITIEDIWQECYKCGTLLGSDSYKDISLSFSLFHLLVLRFFGFTCGESTKQKTQDFVFKGLLEYGSDHDRERAFKVIEFELSFLYDFFFTKYSTLNSRGMTIWALASVASILFVMALTVMRASGGSKAWMSRTHAIVTEPTDAHKTITVVILAALALVEVLQLVIYWTSNWGRVAFVCQYVRQTPSSKANPSCWMRLKAFLTSVNLFSTRKYCWKHQLGQYNLLHSVGHHTCFGSLTHISNICCKIVSIVGLPRNFYPDVPVSLKAWHVLVPSEVRQSLVTYLRQGGGKLTNGAASLECNCANHLLWACSQQIRTSAKEKGTQTRTILTWHIATCYCEMARGSSPPHHAAELKRHMEVATTLSQYCAYLIVNAPQLLPGHMCDTSCLFRAAAREAASVLKDKEDKYEAMRNLAELAEETIFSSGVKLGKQLEEIQDVTRRWTVIAGFWSEMMLYVAPSDNIKAHIEQLANGGEFITQLWALLFHAGILGHHQGTAYD